MTTAIQRINQHKLKVRELENMVNTDPKRSSYYNRIINEEKELIELVS
jgi:hypothetical protein